MLPLEINTESLHMLLHGKPQSEIRLWCNAGCGTMEFTSGFDSEPGQLSISQNLFESHLTSLCIVILYFLGLK